MEHSLPKNLAKEHIEIISDLFDWFIEPCIEFIKQNCKFQLQSSFIHLMCSLMRIFKCLLSDLFGANGENAMETSTQVVSSSCLQGALDNINNNNNNKTNTFKH
jgi:dynein heavy chain